MPIHLLGQNHRTAPVDLREQLAFTAEKQDRLAQLLRARAPVDEGVVLSTCNRVELYTVGPARSDVREQLGQILEEIHGVDLDRWQDTVYTMEDDRAVRHLFQVASGLDSMVLGEGQILSQVRDAFSWAEENRLTREVLPRVFQDAVSCGKRVRTDTSLGEGAVSVAYAAVSLAKKIFRDLSHESVLLIGAGDTGHRVARHFKLFGVRDLRVTNRTQDRAVDLATEMQASMVPWMSLGSQLSQCSIVVSATGASEPVLDAGQIRQALRDSGRRALFLIDLAVPRDIDPAAEEIPGVFLYNVDDLQKIVLDGEDTRRSEAVKAEQIVDEQVDRFLRWYHARDMGEALGQLRHAAERLRADELTPLRAKLDDAEFAEVDRVVERIVNKLLHAPMVNAKEWASREGADVARQRLLELFDLPPHDEDESHDG